MAHDVFVSYSTKDKPVADAVVAGLESQGIRCWFAPRDITPGLTWSETIVQAIEKSKVMVIILSENSNQSHQVLREVERAVSNNVVIIPFRIENIEPTGAMAYYLSTEHWLDALTRPLKIHINNLSRTVGLFLSDEKEVPVIEPAESIKTPEPSRPRWVITGGIILAIAAIAAVFIFLILPRITEPVDELAVGISSTQTSTEQPLAREEITPGAETTETADQSRIQPDSILLIEDPVLEDAINKISNGEMSAYIDNKNEDASTFKAVKEENLDYITTIGSINEITLNPAGPIFDNGKLNPFAIREIREALNWLIDRDYIAQELFNGLALPRYLPINNNSHDYNNYADVVRELEVKYAYNPVKAEEIITKQMNALGAEKVDGVWKYNGETVTLIFIIRNEDRRTIIGDYVADKFETLGFEVERQYLDTEDATDIWTGPPAEGRWHLYTGGWAASIITRDQGVFCNFYYSPKVLSDIPLWQSYQLPEDLQNKCDALASNNFSTLEQRKELFSEALRQTMEISYRVWVNHELTYWPLAPGDQMAYDLFGGPLSTPLWSRTLQIGNNDQKQAILGLDEIPTIINPFIDDGPGSFYNQLIYVATGDFALITDPYTGLALPNRIDKAEVVIQEGLPVRKTNNWITLDFAQEIQIPGDAWADWDDDNQIFITTEQQAADEGLDFLSAKHKTVITYPDDLFDTFKWHDGSSMSIADFVLAIIMYYKNGFAEQSGLEAIAISSQSPLTIEFYSNRHFLDADSYVLLTNLIDITWPIWPQYKFGESPWHSMAISLMAEADSELALTEQDAEQMDIPFLSYISGNSLVILKQKLDQASAENFVPYEATLNEYLNQEEITTRYANLDQWYQDHGHFVIGGGPFYLDQYDPNQNTILLKRFIQYPDSPDKWDQFVEPKIAEVSIDGPDRIEKGSSAIYDVFVTFEGDPYPSGEIQNVKYLVLDASNIPVEVGDAEYVEEGHYRVVLSGEITGAFEAGYSNIDFAVIPSVVVVPSFERAEVVISN